LERPAFCAVYIDRIVKGRFWSDLRFVLFLFIVIFEVAFRGPALFAVCVHRIFKGSFWRDLRWVLFVYIVILKGAFVEN
jgi:ABC-type transporter Mla maintaining outer membrane lipid asymmetry permease subunit MlaE